VSPDEVPALVSLQRHYGVAIEELPMGFETFLG
jgi:hypothetical protein